MKGELLRWQCCWFQQRYSSCLVSLCGQCFSHTGHAFFGLFPCKQKARKIRILVYIYICVCVCVYIWSRDGFRKRFSRAFVSRGTPMAENWRATKGPSSLAAPLLAYTRAKGIPQVPRRLVERKRPDRYVWRLVLFIFIAVHVHAAKALAPTFSYFHTHLGGVQNTDTISSFPFVRERRSSKRP